MPTIATTKADRARRVNAARDVTILPRKPMPVLLVLITVYVDAIDARGLFTFGAGIDPGDALAVLRERLDGAECQDFARVVGVWARDHGATWRG